MKKILIVDDDIIIGISLSKLLNKNDYITKIAKTGTSAIKSLEAFKPDLVLLDFGLPDITGFEVLEHIKKSHPFIIVIMITSFADIKKAVTAIKKGAYDFIAKPFDKKELLNVIKKALSFSTNEDLFGADIEKSMGKSKELKKVLFYLEKAAKTDITVFLEGQTGTGKELFARMIHQMSERKDKPFITVDCASIPENLFESELFGHKKGAFTGAISDKKGKFELANGGTIFLDEINSLPITLQPKFLRVLQENEIIKLGDEYPKKIDVRIIAASNNNIIQDVKDGLFREDLYYRINEFKINLPTLKERKEDIPIIADFFLKQVSKKYHKKVDAFSDEALKTLSEYSWPGNIRELKNVIKSAVILCESQTIKKEHLILNDIKKSSSFSLNKSENFLISSKEKEIIINALLKCKYNKSEAANLLGISRSKLYKLMKKYEIQ